MQSARSTLAVLVISALAIACSTNPATGRRELNIVSESQEIAIGRDSHQQILDEFGVYREKPELNQMVERIGRQLAAQSERPHLPWTFTVLDSPMVNAMALPGGYIYITRGMLERINSEDELAGVLGHEIAHVTARHSAQQISRSQVAQLGMVLGAVVAGPQAVQQYGQLAQLGLSLLFQRYSRQHETEADLLGTGYMAEARFNPIGSERMLMALQRLDKNPAAGIDRYFLSHPEPAKRVRDVQQKIAQLQGMASSSNYDAPDRNGYLQMLDGMITANATQRAVIRDGVVYDRDHGLVVRAPAGWTPTLSPGVLFAMTPVRENDPSYFVAQEIDLRELQGANVQNAIRGRLQQMGLTYVGARDGQMRSGERFAVDVWQGQTQQGAVGVETTQFVHGDHAAVMMFASPSIGARSSALGTLLQQMEVRPSETQRVKAPRIRIGTVRSGETWSEVARRATGNAGDAETIANMNGFDLASRPQAGLTVKLPEEVIQSR